MSEFGPAEGGLGEADTSPELIVGETDSSRQAQSSPAATSREISATVKAALARDPDADVLYVHDEDGQALAALIPIEVWRRELTPPEAVHLPFENYTHGHIAPEDDDA